MCFAMARKYPLKYPSSRGKSNMVYLYGFHHKLWFLVWLRIVGLKAMITETIGTGVIVECCSVMNCRPVDYHCNTASSTLIATSLGVPQQRSHILRTQWVKLVKTFPPPHCCLTLLPNVAAQTCRCIHQSKGSVSCFWGNRHCVCILHSF